MNGDGQALTRNRRISVNGDMPPDSRLGRYGVRGGEGRHTSPLPWEDSINDHSIAETALSFGGVASSAVVGPICDDFSKKKSLPPAPSGRLGRWANGHGHSHGDKGRKNHPRHGGVAVNGDHRGVEGPAAETSEGGRNGPRHEDLLAYGLEDAPDIPPPPPPPSAVSNFGKRWAPKPNSKQSKRRSIDVEDLAENEGGGDDFAGFMGSHLKSDFENMTTDTDKLGRNGEGESKATLIFTNGDGEEPRRPVKLASSIHSSGSGGGRSQGSRPLASSIHSSGSGGRRLASSIPSIHSSGSGGGRSQGRRVFAVEKLKMAQAELGRDDEEGVTPSRKLEVMSLLNSSIRHLEAEQGEELEEKGDDEKRRSLKKVMTLLNSSIRHLEAEQEEEVQEENGRRGRLSRSESDRNQDQFGSPLMRGSDRSIGHRSTRSAGHRQSPPRSLQHRSRGRSEGGRSRSRRGWNSNSNCSLISRGSVDSDDRGERRRRKRTSRGGSKSSRRSNGNEWDGTTAEGGRSSSSSSLWTPIPKEAKEVLSRVRGSEALPREAVVSAVARRLVSRVDRGEGEEEEEDEGTCCVAILSSPPTITNQSFEVCNEGWGAGIGKTTVAALVCVRGDVRTRYHQGIAWLDMCNRPLHLDYERYSAALTGICQQFGIRPQQLRLAPTVRSPGEDGKVGNLRMRDHMEEARERMGKLLTSLHRSRRKSRRDREDVQHTSVLVVLDDVADESDVKWFQFRHAGACEGEQVNDLLVTSRLARVQGSMSVQVPLLESREAVRLLLSEADLPGNHPAASTREAKTLVKGCLLHPLVVKFAGRWLGLKRATSGGHKGIDEILREIDAAVEEAGVCSEYDDPAKVLYCLLNRAMSPLVKGNATKIVRLCFAALITVFFDNEGTHARCSDVAASSSPLAVPLEMANAFFLKVVENESAILSKEDAFFQSNGRQASRLVPEILGALGVFNITRHTTQAEGSERNESSIRIDHDLVRCFNQRIRHEDESMHHLVNDAEARWNRAHVQAYFQRSSVCLWDDIRPNRSRRYALGNMPRHMILAGMSEEAEQLLSDASFIRGRFWSLGWTEGTKLHVDDAKALCFSLNNEGEESLSRLIKMCKQLEAVLMEEVARESGGPNGRCSTLEAGRCLHEMSLSLARCQLWEEASRFCDTCLDLAESNLGPESDLVAGLLYNCSVMHASANEYEEAERKIGDCLDVRVKACGTESILYVRALCQLGDILSLSSDYAAAESCFNKSIGILKIMPARYHLDFGVALYKLGRNQHRRGGYLDEALHCYNEALEFEKGELGPCHIFMPSILMHMGDLLLDKEDVQQAKHTFKEALDVLSEVDSDPTSSFERKIKFAIAEGKLLSIEGQPDECIRKYQRALTLLQRHSPAKKRKIANVSYMIGTEQEKKGNYRAAENFYEESVSTMKSAFGPFHLDIAETLVNLSGVKSALGGNETSSKHHIQATDCLEEAIGIQKSRLGDCEEVAITLTIFGMHLKTIGSYKKAELAFNDAVRILQSLEGDQDLSLADALLGMADLMFATSKYDEAAECYNHCLEIQEAIFGEKNEDVASTIYAMGLVKHAEGVYDKALVYFAKCLVIRVEVLGEAHPAVGDTYDMLGFVEAKNGELDTALRRLSDALKVRKTLGDKLKEADTLNNIGNLHRERNESEFALRYYDDCMTIRLSLLGSNHHSVADVLVSMGNIQSDMENPQGALSYYRKALHILLSSKGPGDPSVASLLQKAGMVLFRGGNLKTGCSFLDQAVEVYRQVGMGYESEIITCLFIIGNIHSFFQQRDEARRAWHEAFEVSKKIGDKSNHEVQPVLARLLKDIAELNPS